VPYNGRKYKAYIDGEYCPELLVYEDNNGGDEKYRVLKGISLND
jgi:hypothetical protein